MTKQNDEMIIAALLSNPTIKAAAAACNCSTGYIYKRLKDRHFSVRYEAARGELIQEATTALQRHLTDAVETMACIMTNEATAPQVRLNAAQAIIAAAVKMTEQAEIIRRLEALEAIQE